MAQRKIQELGHLTNNTSLQANNFLGEFSIEGEIAPGWRVVRTLPLISELDDDGTYLVSEELFLQYGQGETFAEAKQDYINSLIDYYQFLSTSLENDPETHSLFRYLQEFLVTD